MEHPARSTTGPATTINTLRLDDELALIVRPVDYEDHDLIRKSWVAHFENSPTGHAMPRAIYRKEQRWLIEKLIAHADVLVAVDEANPWHVIGWIVGDKAASALHYCFIKSEFRSRGVGKMLFAALLGAPEVVFFTHLRESVPRKHPKWIYDPFLLMRLP